MSRREPQDYDEYEDEDEDCEEDVPEYTGQSSNGVPHGRGSLFWARSGLKFEGRFRDGLRNSRGTMTFEDGATSHGCWVDDVIQGEGVDTDCNGGTICGHFVDGELQGPVLEANAECCVVFRGNYVNGQRDGEGEEVIPCLGGTLRGSWSQGVLSGLASYTYPDDLTVLKGVWRNDEMQSASLVACTGAQHPVKRRKKSRDERAENGTLSYDPSTETVISTCPLLPDPYEQRAVYVAKSKVADGSGEGLFARRDFGPNELCAYYNGVRLSHSVVDGRPWSANSNTMSLDETTVLDVPAPFDDVSFYCASLGHKANHSHQDKVNAEYAPVFNPRFGNIKCVRSIKPIKAGEEICVDYGYTLEKPDWYISFNGH